MDQTEKAGLMLFIMGVLAVSTNVMMEDNLFMWLSFIPTGIGIHLFYKNE